MLNRLRVSHLTRSLWAIGTLTVLELWRSHYMALALVTMATSLALGEATGSMALFDGGRVCIDTGLAALSLACVAISITVGQGLIVRDFGRDGAQVFLAQPLPRGVWVLGRFLGTWFIGVGMAAAMATMQMAYEAGQGRALPPGYLQAVAAVPLEAGVALAVAMALGCMTTRPLAVLATASILLAGYLGNDVLDLVAAQAPEMLPTGRALYVALPHMSELNLRVWAARSLKPPEDLYLWAGIYALAYSSAWLVLGAWAAHRRR